MSLRARLLAGMAVVAVVLIGASVVITRVTRSYLLDQLDAQLVNAGGPRAFDGEGSPPPDFEPSGTGVPLSPVFIAAVDTAGEVQVLARPTLDSGDPALPTIDADQAFALAESGETATVSTDVDGERYRVLARSSPRSDEVIVVGLSMSNVDSAIARLVTVQLVTTLIVLAVLSLVTWWVIRLGVRPIKRMTATATMIAGGDLSHRVPAAAPGTEAGELGVALNQMLGRIETAFDERAASEARLRRFIADASHELRTPVTTIRGYGELYRLGGLEEPRQLDEAMRRTEQEAARMGNLVADLLQLARLDQGRELQQLPVRLDLVVADAAADARAVQPERRLRVDLEAVTVIGDDERLRQVAANLIGNALVHTPVETAIDLDVRVAAAGDDASPPLAQLTVTDHGPGMEPEAVAHAFERFYRADPSRSRQQGGSGLGLSIVESIVVAHGGTVTMTSEPGRGTTVQMQLPLAPRDRATEP
jgi:two-component system OmpR family sensor kinase